MGVGVEVLEACLVIFVAILAIFMLPHYFGHCLPFQKGARGSQCSDYSLEKWKRYTDYLSYRVNVVRILCIIVQRDQLEVVP